MPLNLPLNVTEDGRLDLQVLLALGREEQVEVLAPLNRELDTMSAPERVRWALANLPGEHVLSSSFGIQAALMLHLVSRERADVPVVLTDTGYLFPETYRFIDELTERLALNLKIYRAELSPAWQEARFGLLWEQGVEGITRYNQLNKVEPMDRALRELGAQTWFSGLRREQSGSRGKLQVPAGDRLEQQGRLLLLQGVRPPLPSAVGAGLPVGGRCPHHRQVGTGHERGADPLLRPQARVRFARGKWRERRLRHLIPP